MEYKVAYSDEQCYHEAIAKLEKMVNKLISEGYTPWGGISISTYEVGYGTYTSIAQAMIKE